MTIQSLAANWKTTSAGLSLIFGATVHIIYAIKSGTVNENSWMIFGAGIIGGIGLLVAGDAAKSVQTDAPAKLVNPPPDASGQTVTQAIVTTDEKKPSAPTTTP